MTAPRREHDPSHTPLAERMRPREFAGVFGQEHILGKGKLLAELIESGRIVSIIFWGPPGSGKTTLATMLARHFDLPSVFFRQDGSTLPFIASGQKSFYRASPSTAKGGMLYSIAALVTPRTSVFPKYRRYEMPWTPLSVTASGS